MGKSSIHVPSKLLTEKFSAKLIFVREKKSRVAQVVNSNVDIGSLVQAVVHIVCFHNNLKF